MERRHSSALFWTLYAAAALAIDFAATRSVQTPINWRVFHWQLDNGFDVYKFLAWFAFPFILNIRNIQVSYFTFAHWRKIDWILLGLVVGAGAIIMILIPYFPSARQLYGSRAHLNMAAKWSYFRYQFLWILSWLIGWEFLHRYVLATRFAELQPRLIWVVIPILEGLYHCRKPWPEIGLMVLFSLIFTPWVIGRRNSLLPLLAHFVIEVELVIFQLLV